MQEIILDITAGYTWLYPYLIICSWILFTHSNMDQNHTSLGKLLTMCQSIMDSRLPRKQWLAIHWLTCSNQLISHSWTFSAWMSKGRNWRFYNHYHGTKLTSRYESNWVKPCEDNFQNFLFFVSDNPCGKWHLWERQSKGTKQAYSSLWCCPESTRLQTGRWNNDWPSLCSRKHSVIQKINIIIYFHVPHQTYMITYWLFKSN